MLAKVVKDTASPKIADLMRRLSLAEQMRTLLQWGASVRKAAQESALRKGGRRFWRQIARSVLLEPASGAVTVLTRHVAAAQMQYGGRIGAPGKHSEDPAQSLTIPIEGSPAEGRRASEFTNLFRPTGTSILAMPGATGQPFIPLFILRKSVQGAKNPWWPEDREIAGMGEKLALRRLGLGNA